VLLGLLSKNSLRTGSKSATADRAKGQKTSRRLRRNPISLIDDRDVGVTTDGDGRSGSIKACSRRNAGFHTFRHSAATIVNQKTGNLKLIPKLLGHSNLSTTADVYTHISADADRRAALALEQAIFGDLFQVVPRFGNMEQQHSSRTGKSMHTALLGRVGGQRCCWSPSKNRA
jgi:hypothetical protein